MHVKRVVTIKQKTKIPTAKITKHVYKYKKNIHAQDLNFETAES